MQNSLSEVEFESDENLCYTMGLMAIANLECEFYSNFAGRKRSRGQQFPSRPSPQRPFTPPSGDGGFRFGRRHAVTLGAVAATGVAVAVLKPWEIVRDYQQKNEWQNSLPTERITRLELKQHPSYRNFDPTQEMISATADYYCAREQCSSDTLKKSVSLTNTQRIIEEIEFDNGRPLTTEERELYGKETTEMFGVKRRLVLINQQNLAVESTKIGPRSTEELRGRDPYAVMLKSTLIHAYTHSIAEKEGFPIGEIIIPGPIPTTYDRIGAGFVFFGRWADGTPVSLGGGDEAITEYIATSIGQDTGGYLSGSAYTSGVRLVEMLNLRAGIPIEDFKDYFTGRKPKRELFRRWGALKNRVNPDEQSALAALAVIALRVNYPQNVTQEQAVTSINDLLRP